MNYDGYNVDFVQKMIMAMARGRRKRMIIRRRKSSMIGMMFSIINGSMKKVCDGKKLQRVFNGLITTIHGSGRIDNSILAP